jgi:hypothetical protein
VPVNAQGLFAARPDLPQELISALSGDKVSGKSAVLFGYLCGARPCKAFRAEHDFAGDRIKSPEEVNIAIRAPDVGQVVEDTHLLRTRNSGRLAASIPLAANEASPSEFARSINSSIPSSIA